MNQESHELLTFVGLVALFALVGGLLLRRWWMSSLLATGLAALVVPMSAVVDNGWRARPSDVAFWLPMMAMWAAIYAAPIAFGVGFLVHLIRKRKARI